MRQTITLSLALLLSLPALGCVGSADPGDSEDPSDPFNPPGDPPDPEDPPEEELPPCTLSGAVALAGGLGEGFVDDLGVYYVHSSEDETQGIDVSLYAGEGPFANGIVAGTFDLTESPEECGVCAGYFAEANDSGGYYYLAATSGTLEITEVTASAGSAFRGSLSGVTFSEIDELDQVVSGGCSVDLDSLSFDVTLAQGSLEDDEAE